jgi:hypothetical protein
MGTTLPRSSSGLATVSTALVHALGLTRIRAIALALDGEPIGIPREAFFDAFANCVRSGEMVLSALGYRMVIDRGGVSPKLPRRLWVLFREMSIDPDAYHAVIRSLPREIPLTAVQPLRVRKAFNTMAAFRAPSYADPSRISLQSLATSVNRIIAAEPRPFGRVVVRHLSAVFPVVIAALEGLKASHLPLISGCSYRFAAIFAQGQRHPGLDHHVTLYRQLDLRCRVIGPGGEITIRPQSAGISRILDSLAAVQPAGPRQGGKSPATTDSAPPATAPPSKTARRGRLGVDEIVARLKAGVPPLDIARDAQVSHQYIYKVAREAGMNRRESSRIFALEALRELRR